METDRIMQCVQIDNEEIEFMFMKKPLVEVELI